MGIHYFYTWLTYRYPHIKVPFDSKTTPQIDYLYLDLNGIIHRCAKDESALFKDLLCGKKTEEIYISILNYTNFIISQIKPRKGLVIAVDGVAPRAKMNNQRNRRFMASKTQSSVNDFMINTLKISPNIVYFKNNSISPGTEFMIELNKAMYFMIQRKLHEDISWKGLEVIFSGGDVPGEGEHKILNYIRQKRQSPNFNIEDSHCIYGNDSDLVLLSLLTHLPNVMLLREEFKLGKNTVINSATKRTSDPQGMEVIYINILREYFQIEFACIVKENPTNLEHIIDDFVLFSFFIGNDFLHQVYCMNTKMGIFDEFIEIVLRFYKENKRFLTNKAGVDWQSFYMVLKEFLPLQKKMITTTIADFNSRLSELHKNSFYSQLKKQQQEMKKEEPVEKKKTHFGKNQFEVFEKPDNQKNNAKLDEKKSTGGDLIILNLMSELKLKDDDEVLEVRNNKMKVAFVKDGLKEAQTTTTVRQTENEESAQGIKSTKEQANDKNENIRENKMESDKTLPGDDKESSSEEDDLNDRFPHGKMTINDFNEHENLEVDEEGNSENEEINLELTEEQSKKYLEEFKSQYQKLVKARDLMQVILRRIENDENYQEIYYKEYFGISEDYEVEVSKICYNYLNGVDFVYKYYYSGCPSWSWFYRYHLSPLLFDLYSYLKRMFENGQEIRFDYEPSVAVDPYIQLLYILPRESLNLLPESLIQKVLEPNSPIRRYYPLSFDITPFDKHKDYTWLAMIEHIDDDKMNDFINKMDYNSFLTDEEKFRNRKGDNYSFKFDEKGRVVLDSPVSGFERVLANVKIKVITIDSEFSQMASLIDYKLSCENQKKRALFPSINFAKTLKFNKSCKRNRFKYDLLLTCDTLEEMLDHVYKLQLDEKLQGFRQNYVFCSPIEQKKFVIRKVEWYDSSDQSSRLQSITEATLSWLESIGIYVPNEEFKKFKKRNKEIPTFCLQTLSFTSVEYTGTFAQQMNVETGLENDNEYLFFIGVLGNSFLKLKEFPRADYKDWLQPEQICFNALTGDLIKIKEIKRDKVPRIIAYEVLNRNQICKNINLRVPDEPMHLIDERLIQQLGLRLEDLKILWLVLDSIKILSDHSSPTTLVLGDGFEIGLNFINFLNRRPEDWKLVSDMIRVFFKFRHDDRKPVRKNSTNTNECMFLWEDPSGTVTKFYNVFLTNRGLTAVQEYFKENQHIIQFLKDNSKSLIYFDKKARVFRYKTQFRATQIFENLSGEDINIHLFKIYSEILKKSHSNLQLMPSLCFNYSIDFIHKQLASLKFPQSKAINEEINPIYLMKYSPMEDVVWPPFGVKPYFHEDGDRVAFINSQHHYIKFGVLGIVVGVYNDFVEVLFDEPFIGGTSLFGRCPNFRGKLVKFFDLYNLSKWNNIVVELEDKPKNKKKLWDGRFDMEGFAKMVNEKQKRLWKVHS